MKEWYGKFNGEIKLESNAYVVITVKDSSDDAQVLLFPHQAREVAEHLLKMADEADKTRLEEKKDYEVCPGCDSKMEKEEDKNAECPNPNCDWFA